MVEDIWGSLLEVGNVRRLHGGNLPSANERELTSSWTDAFCMNRIGEHVIHNFSSWCVNMSPQGVIERLS